jgi:exonuclease III
MSQPSTPRHLAVTVNVRGFKDGGKLRALLECMQLQAVQMVVFTETHNRESPEVLLGRTPGSAAVASRWRFHHVPGVGATGGVIIGISASSPLASFCPWTEHDGDNRVLRLDGRLDGAPASIIGIYAPSPEGERRRFYASTLPLCMPQDGRLVIMGGDFNLTLSDEDIVRPGGAGGEDPATRATCRQALQQIIHTHSLVDVWRRHAAPGERAFTHWSGSANSGARLDFWLVSEALAASSSSRIESCVVPGVDHRQVSLSLRADTSLRGKGLNTFPLLVFSVRPAFEELQQLVEATAAALGAVPDQQLVAAWSDTKEIFRSGAHKIYGRHKRGSLQAAKAKAREAAAAARKLSAGPTPGGPDEAQLLQAWRAAEEAAKAAWAAVLRPVKEAAEMVDQAAGEASSYYFFSRAKVRSPPEHISVLNRPGRPADAPPEPAATDTEQGLAKALQYGRAFFSSESPFGLFRQPDGISLEAQSALLGSLPRRLSEEHAGLAEGPDGTGLLAEEEMILAIRASSRGSAPGWDGLPYEFFRVFERVLAPVLVRAFNAAFQDTLNAAPLAQLLQGVICLLAKPGQSREELAGYRPITLLNCDVKLVMWILSARLQLPLDYLIDIGQSAFLRSRDITDNVRYHLGLAARLQELGVPGWLLLVDMSKAYDSVARCWLRSSMVAMGFREAGAARWCRLLLDGSTCRVRINGVFSVDFPVENGLFQGSSLSCQEWVIVLQPLVSYLDSLQAQGRIQPLLLPGPAGAAPAPLAAEPGAEAAPALAEEAALAAGPAPAPAPALAAEPAEAGFPAQAEEAALAAAPAPALAPASASAPAPAACAYADDTKLPILRPDRDGPAVLEAFAVARSAGMPALNASKTRLLPLFSGPAPPASISTQAGADGERRHSPTGFHTLEPGHPPHRLLGVPFSADANACAEEAFAGMLPKVRDAAQPWRSQQLSVFGKACVAGQCLASKLIYQANFAKPGSSLSEVQLELSRFICAASTPEEEAPFSGRPFLPQALLMLPPAAGGVGAPALQLAAASMRAKPVWKAFAYASHPARALFEHEICRALPVPADAPAGLHCLVTRPSLQPAFPAHATLSTVHAVEAFRELKVQRIAKRGQQDFWSVMHELTFAAAGSEGGPQQGQLATPAARQWLRLSQVRAAWLDREQLPPEQLADLTTILQALPAEWSAEVQREGSPVPEWSCVLAGEGSRPAVFQGPDLGSAATGEVRLWELSHSGVLLPLSFPVAPSAPTAANAALVVWRPKPQIAWTRAEIEAAQAQGLLPPHQRVGIRQPQLVGVWDEMPLDPRVFGVPDSPGLQACSLLDLTAGRARKCLAHLQRSSANPSSSQFVPGYAQEGAAFPESWRQAPAAEEDLAVLHREALERLGLAGQEEKWRRSVEQLRQLCGEEAMSGYPLNRPQRWLNLQAGPQPRPSPADRAAGRQATQQARAEAAAAVAQEQLPAGWAAAWQRLADPTIHRPYRATVWRVMQARLGCGAFLVHARASGGLQAGRSAAAIGVPLEVAWCKAPCCSSLAQPPLETISHALLLCPAVAPVVVWMREVWASLAHVPLASVPSSAEVLLSDRLDSWPDAPVGKGARRLWTRLRVATLGAIWQARCERGAAGLGGLSLARRAATLALGSVLGGIQRDWARAGGLDTASLPAACSAWFRGLDVSMRLESFKQLWASPDYFCEVVEEEGSPPQLVIRLGDAACPPLPA